MSSAASGVGPFPRRIFISDQHIERLCRETLESAGLLPESPGPIRIDRFIFLQFGFEVDGLCARLRGQQRFATWKELGFKAFACGKLQGPLKTLTTLAGGRHILQRRSNETERKQISRARKILCDLFPIPGDPFHKFSDGYGILFHVELSAAQRTVRAWEDTERDNISTQAFPFCAARTFTSMGCASTT